MAMGPGRRNVPIGLHEQEKSECRRKIGDGKRENQRGQKAGSVVQFGASNISIFMVQIPRRDIGVFNEGESIVRLVLI